MLVRLVVLALLTAALQATGSSNLRVMTFNIHAGHGDLSRIASVIDAASPDVVALQEVDVHWDARSGFVDQARTLAAATGMDVRFAPIYQLPGTTPDAPMREFGVAVLSRLPITSWRNHAITRLSTQDGAAGPAPAPGFLEATIRTSGGDVDVFVTHLDFRRDPAVRQMQVAEMLAVVKASSRPVILTGDMNAPPDAAEIRPLRQALRDVWNDSDGNGATFPAEGPSRRIDFVLVSRDIEVRRARVVRTDASDHLPVVADLVLPR